MTGGIDTPGLDELDRLDDDEVRSTLRLLDKHQLLGIVQLEHARKLLGPVAANVPRFRPTRLQRMINHELERRRGHHWAP